MTADELSSLTRQGFVSAELRSGTLIYKLRFRHDGRQQVHWLGRDPQRAADVRAALGQLQAGRKLQLHCDRSIRAAQRFLRTIKPRLAAAVAAEGYVFHGRAIRRPRANR